MASVGEELTYTDKADLGLSLEEADPGHTSPTVGEAKGETVNTPYHLTGPDPIDPIDSESADALAKQARELGTKDGQRLRTSTRARNMSVGVTADQVIGNETEIRHETRSEDMPEVKNEEQVEQWDSEDGPTEEEAEGETEEEVAVEETPEEEEDKEFNSDDDEDNEE